MATLLSRTTSSSSTFACSSALPRTSSLTSPHFLTSTSLPSQQRRPATFIPRPKRPYTFTQLVTLSDGSTYLHRTSNPFPLHRSTKDQRNSPLWNPSSARLRAVEADAAGRLRAFRARFGRGWDAQEASSKEVRREAEEGEEAGRRALRGEDEEDGELAAPAGPAGMEGGEMESYPSSGEPPVVEEGKEGNMFDLISGFKRDETVERGMQIKKKDKKVEGGGKRKK